MQLTARLVTAPAARNHRPRTPGPSPPRAPLRPPPGAVPDRQPGTVGSGAFSGPAGRRVGRPARRHRRASRTGRGRGRRQSRQLIARSVRWREPDKPRKHPAICQVTSSRPPKPAGLPPAWLHLTVTARRFYGTRYPPTCAADPDRNYPQGIPIWTMCVTSSAPGGTASRGQGGAGSPARVGCRRTVMSPLRGASSTRGSGASRVQVATGRSDGSASRASLSRGVHRAPVVLASTTRIVAATLAKRRGGRFDSIAGSGAGRSRGIGCSPRTG